MKDPAKDISSTPAGVIIAFERGSDLTTIADQTGETRHRVTKHLKREGYKQRKKGRTSFAVIARAREMADRDWPPNEISRLLKADLEQVKAWLKRSSDPVRKDGLDVISIRGRPLKRYRPSRMTNPSKKWKPPSKEVVNEDDLPYINMRKPPPAHKKGKWWSLEEEAYVLELMKTGQYTIRQIYERSRASRRQQLRIWRRYRGEGAFPPAWPEITPDEARAIWEAKQAGKSERVDAIVMVAEERAVARRKTIAKLEAQAVEDEKKIKLLEEKQKILAAERAAKERRLSKIEKTISRRRVLPGSFEEEQLGLKPGALIESGRPGRPAEKPKGLGEYADNGSYFVVSKDWADLEDASADELALFADYLKLKKFPARVEKSGDQPEAYFENKWPKKVESRWVKAVDGGLTLLERYRDRKRKLASKKIFSRGIAKYLAKGFEAHADTRLTKAQKAAAMEEFQDEWARLKKIDRLILIFSMGVADKDGTPTSKGIERGRAAKILLERESDVAAKKLAEKKKAHVERRAVQVAERDEVADILSGGRLALGVGADDEGEE